MQEIWHITRYEKVGLLKNELFPMKRRRKGIIKKKKRKKEKGKTKRVGGIFASQFVCQVAYIAFLMFGV